MTSKISKKTPTFEGFIAWLEKQPPKAKYEWGDCKNCAIAQYVAQFGIADVNSMPYAQYAALEGGRHAFIAMNAPWTFGAALKRAKAVLNKRASEAVA